MTVSQGSPPPPERARSLSLARTVTLSAQPRSIIQCCLDPSSTGRKWGAPGGAECAIPGGHDNGTGRSGFQDVRAAPQVQHAPFEDRRKVGPRRLYQKADSDHLSPPTDDFLRELRGSEQPGQGRFGEVSACVIWQTFCRGRHTKPVVHPPCQCDFSSIPTVNQIARPYHSESPD